MTRDDIIEAASKAGFNWPEIHTTTIEERLERFAALVAAAERKRLCDAAERCRMCEQKGVRHEQTKGDETD